MTKTLSAESAEAKAQIDTYNAHFEASEAQRAASGLQTCISSVRATTQTYCSSSR
jgi:hypothetical protein